MRLAVSTDMLVAGTHFFADTDPADLGWKTLAVNVSDLAAMGALPRWVVLAASLHGADENWIGVRRHPAWFSALSAWPATDDVRSQAVDYSPVCRLLHCRSLQCVLP